jgi:prepilin-type N-terminal cleavage/methylation domain-containing protein
LRIRSRLRRGFTLIEVMTAAVILIILMALALGMLSFAGRARMNNAVFDAASLISAAQMRAVSSGVPHYILIHLPPPRDIEESYLRIHILERPDELGPGGIATNEAFWNGLNLVDGPERALAFQPAGAPTATDAISRGRLGLAVSSGPDRRDVSFLDLNSERVRGLVRRPFNNILLDTGVDANPLDLPSADLMAGCNFCVNPSGNEPYGVLRFNADGTMQVMTGDPEPPRTGAAIAFAPNTEDEQAVIPRLLVVAAPAGATVVY